MDKEIIYLDLFSGIGGFSSGLQRADFTFKKHYFSEIDKHATAVYKHQFNNSIELGDIHNVKGSEIERPDIITFGFPCQDLSIAGKGEGLSGKRSGLFFQAVRVIKETFPSVFIFENVKGLLSSNKGADFEIVLQAIADIGLYECEWQLVNTSWLLPQNRERIYFIGHLRTRSRARVFPIRESDFESIEKQRSDAEGEIASCLQSPGNACGNYKGMNAIQVDKRKMHLEGNIYPSKGENGNIYNTGGISPTIKSGETSTKGNGGIGSNNSPKIIVNSATKCGYETAQEGNTVNFEQPYSKTRKGRVGKQKAQTLNTSNHQGVIVTHDIQQIVKVRKYDVDVLGLQGLLKEHKNITISNIAEKLNIPKTKVEHWFRTDKCFSIPDSNDWMGLKELLNIDTDKYDKQIMEFEEKLGNFDMGNRAYDESGISPTLLGAKKDYNIIVKPMRWVRSEKGKKLRKESMDKGKDYTPFSDGSRELIESDEKNVGCITNAVNKDCLVSHEMKVANCVTPDAYLTKGERKRDENGKAVLTSMHERRIRKLTETECERLQGFPDNWTEYGNYNGETKKLSKTQRYKQLGNAVTVDIVEMIAKRL